MNTNIEKLVEASRQIGAEKMAMREAYIAQYLEKTGYDIAELELVNYTDYSASDVASEVWYLRKRGTV